MNTTTQLPYPQASHRPLWRRSVACIVCALALLALAVAAPAQDKPDKQDGKQEKLPKYKIDKYTKNKPEALAQAGYVTYGPMSFGGLGGGVATTTTIEKTLPYAPLIWIETKHFRIGMDLPEWPVPTDLETRNKLRRELERLHEKIPEVPLKAPRMLDPWLRAHLFAQRAEDVYAEFCTLAGLKDEDFPADASKVVAAPGSVYMGYGPYLGMKEKYLLLMFENMTSFQTYMKAYLGRESKSGQRWHFKDVSCLIYTIASECDGGRLKDDTALHCNVAFNLSQNLLDGFRYYAYDLPVWIREGLGHWFERRIDPKWNSYDQTEGSPADYKATWRWEPLIKGFVSGSGGKFAPFSEAYAWRDFGTITFNDHLAIWSRVDWMLSQDKAKWRALLFEVKGRINPDWTPNQNDLVGAMREGLQKAYGVSVLSFDEKWAEWVKATYPSQ